MRMNRAGIGNRRAARFANAMHMRNNSFRHA
jgi:hypothetical protein